MPLSRLSAAAASRQKYQVLRENRSFILVSSPKNERRWAADNKIL